METKWIEAWTPGPHGVMRIICQGDIVMGDDVEMTVIPALIKSLPGRKGSFKFTPKNIEFADSRKGLKVEDGEYLTEENENEAVS